MQKHNIFISLMVNDTLVIRTFVHKQVTIILFRNVFNPQLPCLFKGTTSNVESIIYNNEPVLNKNFETRDSVF